MAILFARTISDTPWDRTPVIVDWRKYITTLRGEVDLTKHPYRVIQEVSLNGRKVHWIVSAKSPKGLNVADIQKMVVKNVSWLWERITAEITKK